MANWLEYWENNEINWHSDAVTEELEAHLGLLKLKPGDKVFVPLCGKSIDMTYLLNQGFSVIGVELSEIGIKQFFLENGLDFTITQIDEFDIYRNNKHIGTHIFSFKKEKFFTFYSSSRRLF